MQALRFLPHALAAAIAAQAAPALSATELEEVTVTAQKRTERLTDVPIAITSVSAENIEQTGVRQLKEVAEFVPNLTISSGTDFTSSVSIRGVGANSRNIGFDTRVGVYLDGVYLGQSPALNQELLDLERIEVLRGPQGTLFGKNTVAGAINLVSKQPDNTFGGRVGVDYGNYNSRQLTASVNLPLSDKLFSKVSVSSQQRDGLVHNKVTGHDLNELDGNAYRAQLLYNAGDNFTASISLDGMDSDRLSYMGDPVTDTFGVMPESAAPAENTVSTNLDPHEQRQIRGTALTLDWDLASGYAIKSITASRDTDISYVNDVDYAAWDLISLDFKDSYHQLSQELQLISPDADALKYVAGLYLYQQEGDSVRQVIFSELAGQLFGTDPARPGKTDGTVDTRSYAAFLNGSYDLSERWKLGFGFRYSLEDKKVDWSIDGRGVTSLGFTSTTVRDERSENNFTPTININYAFSPDINGYAKYSSGYKSGGFNLDFVNASALDAGIDFDTETVDAYEMGLKGTLWQRRLGFSLAAFRADYSNYQVNQFVDLGEGRSAISIRNAASVETQGLEAELSYRPTDNLQLTAALGLLDATFASYPGGGAGGSDVSGNKLPGVSDYSVNLGAQYYYPLPSLGAELLLRLDYAYRDDYYNTVDNEKSRTLLSGDTVQFGWVDGYGLLNARLGLQSDSETWSAALWARNLTDEEYLTNTLRDFFGTLTHFEGTPRTFGVDVSYRF